MVFAIFSILTLDPVNIVVSALLLWLTYYAWKAMSHVACAVVIALLSLALLAILAYLIFFVYLMVSVDPENSD